MLPPNRYHQTIITKPPSPNRCQLLNWAETSKAFTASASVPTIYIQQFWNTLTQEAKTGVYRFQLDKDWFILNTNLLREALEITPIVQAHQFESPPSGDAIMDFVNALGYPEEIHFVSRMVVNNLYQPWRAILLMINQCLTCMTSGFDRPRYPVLQMLWDDHHLGNLKFIPKGEEDEVFGMQIPKELITDNTRNAPYYNAYLEMVAKHNHKIAAEEGGKKKSTFKANQPKKPATTKQSKPVSSKQSKPALAKQPKPVKDKSTKPSPVKKVGKEQAQPEPKPEPQGEEVDYDLQRVIQMSLESSQPPVGGVAFRKHALGITHKLLTVEGKGKGPFVQPEDDTSANIVRDTLSPTNSEIGAETDKTNSEGDTEILNIGKEQGEDVANKVDLEEKTAEINEGQAGSDPDPEPMHDDFVATVYPQVHESLKHPDEEHVHFENPLSSTGTLSSMKNLDNFTFGDHFIADKSPKDEPRNANMETEVESMVTVPIHQASSSVPPLSTPVIDLSPPKPVSSPAQAPIFTTTTTTLPLPLPPQ
ncbi:hypothetical protein Tco_0699264 [Tanacetum coccineum]